MQSAYGVGGRGPVHLTVRHETLYRYSVPVALAPHVLRLNPRHDGIDLLSHVLTIEPDPTSRCDRIDRYGNAVTHLTFAGTSDRLRIVSELELDTVPMTPPPVALPLLPWSPQPKDELIPFRVASHHGAVRTFALALASEVDYAALPFLDRLNRMLFARIDRHIRIEGAAQAPEQTLATWRGACRDITILFLAACRALGMAARFVSGYQAQAETPDGRRHLHAWPEMFLPGAGWRGFDPTHGTAVSDGYVALCSAPDQAGTMPVEGAFYGNGVTAKLDYAVNIAAQ